MLRRPWSRRRNTGSNVQAEKKVWTFPTSLLVLRVSPNGDNLKTWTKIHHSRKRGGEEIRAAFTPPSQT